MNYNIKFNEERNGIFPTSFESLEYRRLSTKSSVLATLSQEKRLTEWKWYWKETKDDWREYIPAVSIDATKKQKNKHTLQKFNNKKRI